LHGIGGRRNFSLPFKLIVTKVGDRLTCHATPSKPNQLPYQLRPPANEEADLNARPTMINTAARR
jgi:hypothetical protein